MKNTLESDGLTCDYIDTGSNRICYILGPLPLDEELLAAWSHRYDIDLVSIHGMDWDNDLTPWGAAGVMPRDAPFAGHAEEFLTRLRTAVLPDVEQALQTHGVVERTLIGVSLSGLFALWAWLECDDFLNLGSLSGSFWYDGFADWVCRRPSPEKQGRAFFLLGDKEQYSSVRRFQSVEAETRRIVRFLSEAGIDASFELVPGTHFAPIEPRLERTLDALYKDHR